jgi:large subunit GTPase 1
LAITPFEKNIEVWRQLWRVIEKSDFLMQIVDARNPEFFYASDLDQYIKDVAAKGNKKEFVLLINKSDFLSPELLKHWNEYFKEKGVQHLFFSALAEQEKLDLEDEEIDRQAKEQQNEPEAKDSDSDAEDDEEKRVAKEVADELEKIRVEDAMHSNKQNTVFTNEFMEADEQDKAIN